MKIESKKPSIVLAVIQSSAQASPQTPAQASAQTSAQASGQTSAQTPARAIALAILMAIVLATSSTVWAKKVEYRKSQDVNFDAVDVDGTVRNPDGAYLAQKRGIDFMPLYKVRKNFDDSIKESVEFVK